MGMCCMHANTKVCVGKCISQDFFFVCGAVYLCVYNRILYVVVLGGISISACMDPTSQKL